MRVSRLEAFGFKSFMDRLVLPLDKGLTGVVGPNGCGKSNIVDALRWVLGETRASQLRGGVLEDVIFNGTDKLKPLGIAEVSITLKSDSGDFLSDLIASVERRNQDMADSASLAQPGADGSEVGTSEPVISREKAGAAEEPPVEVAPAARPRFTVLQGALSTGASSTGARDAQVKESPVAETRVDESGVDETPVDESKGEDAKAQDALAQVAGANVAAGDKSGGDEQSCQVEATGEATGEVTGEVPVEVQAGAAGDPVGDKKTSKELENPADDENLARRFGWLKGVAEVQATRRLYRSGESEYFLNRVPCRLKDLKDFFRVCGLGPRTYTIVAQGEVGRIISAKPEERRLILEEAAGVLGLRERTNEANRRLEETRTNLVRIQDIETELGRQVASLKRQAQRAITRQELKTELFELERRLYRTQTANAEAKKQEGSKRAEDLSQRVSGLESQFEELKVAEEQVRASLLEADVTLEGVRKNCDGLKDELNRRSRARLERLSRVQEAKAVLAARQTELSRLQERERTLNDRKAASEREIAQLEKEDQELSEKLKVQDVGDDRLRQLNQRLSELRDALRKKEAAVRDVRERMSAQKGSLSAIQDQLIAASPLKQLSQSLGSDFIKQISGSVKAFIDGIKVPEKYSRATQAVLAERSKFLISSDPHQIAEAFRRYYAGKSEKERKGAGLGVVRAGRDESAEPAREIAGAEALLSVVTVSDECHRAAHLMLKGVYFVESLAAAKEVFAREQQAIEAEAQAVSNKPEVNQASTQEASTDAQGEANAGDRADEASGDKNNEGQATANFSIAKPPTATKKMSLQGLVFVTADGEILSPHSFYSLHHEGGLIQLRLKAEKLQETLSFLEKELQVGSGDRDANAREVQEAEAEHSRTLREIQQRQAAIREMGKQQGSVRGRIYAAKNTLQQIKSDADRSNHQMNDIRARLQELEQRVITLEAEANSAAPDNDDELKRNLEEQQRELTRLEGIRREGRTKVDEKARAVASIRNELDRARQSVSHLQLEIQKIKLERENLELRMCDEFGEEVVAEWQAAAEQIPVLEGAEEPKAVQRVHEIRTRMRKEGEVDPSSIQRYEEESARLDPLKAQRDDLDRAAKSIEKSIEELKATSTKKFIDTFTQVRRNFSILAPRLYGGGSADLELTLPETPLESGVEIVVRPPGKKPKTIDVLSGGEKALCATALIFSMFLVRPSPLCVLDEVDAPLDEANLLRFLDVIKEMSTHTQFLMITHNKGSMAVAEQLVGVTQAQPGASRILSVSLEEAVKQVA